jgi:hypothetical protein
MTTSQGRLVLTKEQGKQLQAYGLDPDEKNPLADDSIIKMCTVLIPIASKTLVEAGALLRAGGKPTCEVYEAAAEMVRGFGRRPCQNPDGQTGVEMAQNELDEAKNKVEAQQVIVKDLKRAMSETSSVSESIQTRSRNVGTDEGVEELRQRLVAEEAELNRLKSVQAGWRTVDIIVYSALSLVVDETKGPREVNVAKQAKHDCDAAASYAGRAQSGIELMREIEKQMSAHFVTLMHEVEVLMQPNNPYWAELFLHPKKFAEKIKDVIRAQEVFSPSPVTPNAEAFATQMLTTYTELTGTDSTVYLFGYKDLLGEASMTGSTMDLREFAEKIKELCDSSPALCDRKPPSTNVQAFQVTQVANERHRTGARSRPTNSRSKNEESIYPPGEELGCRRCHALTHYARDCPERKAARAKLEARKRQTAARN